MAEQILRRLKFDNETISRVCSLVRWHDDNPPLTARNVRRAIYRIGEAQYPAIFAVKRADIGAQSDYKKDEKFRYVDDYEALYREIVMKGDCLSVKGLAVNGADLIAAGVPQGKTIGAYLRRLLELVLEEPRRNEKDFLMEQVKIWMAD